MKKKSNMAKASKHINNLSDLEKEIYRLRYEAKEMELKLDSNIDFFKKNYAEIIVKSVMRQPVKESVKEKIAEMIWNNPKVQQTVDKMLDGLVTKAVDTAEKIFEKKSKDKEQEE